MLLQDQVKKDLVTATAASSLIACFIMGDSFAALLTVLQDTSSGRRCQPFDRSSIDLIQLMVLL